MKTCTGRGGTPGYAHNSMNNASIAEKEYNRET